MPQPAGEEEFFDLSVDPLCVVGFDGRFKRVNAALQRVLGYAEHELFERTVFDLTHPDDVAAARAAMERGADGQDLIGIEVRVVRADGTVRWLEWKHAPGARARRRVRRGQGHDGAQVRGRRPVVVEGRTWGVLAAIWSDGEPPSDDTEARMASFAELLDTAIVNADSRDQLDRVARAACSPPGDDARRRVVRDLHDGAQQRLVHTIVTLKFAQQALRAGAGRR